MEDEIRTSEMTVFGKALWLVIQEKGPYNRSSFARLLGQKTGWEPSRQAMSNWLKGEREAPRVLVPATVMALGLGEETARQLEHLYFYGQPGLPAKIERCIADDTMEPGFQVEPK